MEEQLISKKELLDLSGLMALVLSKERYLQNN